MTERARGLSLLEVLIVSALLSVLVLAAFSTVDAGNRVFNEGTLRQNANLQAQRVLDAIAQDLRGSAAFDYFLVQKSGDPAASPLGSGGETVTRLTRFWATKKRTRGATSDTSSFQFGPFSATNGAALGVSS